VKRTIRVAKEYPHPAELVWRALTEPALIAAWLMDNDFAPVLGHRFTLRTEPAPGFDGIVHGEVLEVEPPRRMRWRWRGGPIDTEVSFTLSPVGIGAVEGTRLEVEHSGFEGPAAVLVSFILQSGNRKIYGRRLPAVLAGLAAPVGQTAAPCAHERGLWYLLARLGAPLLRRAQRRRDVSASRERRGG
jgi:uncharacterized protein YndB with AHSA1/START domain